MFLNFEMAGEQQVDLFLSSFLGLLTPQSSKLECLLNILCTACLGWEQTRNLFIFHLFSNFVSLEGLLLANKYWFKFTAISS